MTWIRTDEELPPCDGTYIIANEIWDGQEDLSKKTYYPSLAKYDGYDFILDGIARPMPNFWKFIEKHEKRYRKLALL